MDWVVDCSIALALCFPDKASEHAEDFLDKARSAVFWVPSLWWYELANAIAVARRRGGLDEAEIVGTAWSFTFPDRPGVRLRYRAAAVRTVPGLRAIVLRCRLS
jgi:hypothetical protein